MTLTFALSQSNFTVGFFEGSSVRMSGLHDIAKAAGADMIVFSEMAITGYPLEDLALHKEFQDRSMQVAEDLAHMTANGPALLAGGIWREGNALYNAVFLMDGGKIVHRQYKHHLPNYGVFDEKRIFMQGPMPEPFEWRGIKLGLLICEDMWLADVAAHLKNAGAELLISINASPFETGKAKTREDVAMQRVRETGLPLIYVNPVGGQDELVFDGRSFALSAQGEIRLRMQEFKEDFTLVTCAPQDGWAPPQGLVRPVPCEEETLYRAMMTGLHDFVNKNGFAGVVLGMSGGIDSALSAAVAVDALGSERVRCVMMPSPITSPESVEDAQACAHLLGIRIDIIPIAPGMQAFSAMAAPLFTDATFDDQAASNQTRLRSSILLAISSRERLLLLNTGNKSEMAVGFTTMYGDLCGHYSVLKDVYKTTLYKVVQWRNSVSEVIPQRIITKPPSAELTPGQFDQDTLPPYEMLDAILVRLVEERLPIADVVAQGFDEAIVRNMAGRLFFAEYKRRQSPPGVKLTKVAFGRDRRYPLSFGTWLGHTSPK